MKKFIIAVVAIAVGFVQANAMSHTRAQAEALFLTDKMAYELNLTNAQYDAVYEINYDYFVSLVGTTDILGIFWNRRERELEWVLTDWQYRAYLTSSYFYRPVAVYNNTFRFAIYDRYAHNRYYKPVRKIYKHYRGGHNYGAPGHGLAANHPGKVGPNHGPADKPGKVAPNNGPSNKPGKVAPNNGGNKPGKVAPNNGGNKPGKVAPNNGGNKPNKVAPTTGANKPAASGNRNANVAKPRTNAGTATTRSTVTSSAPRASRNAPAARQSSNAVRASSAGRR
ncbi:MAG: hypothetical protein IKX71_09525 [Bacteroidales bacterium]|nr:hypothetical protein [Bacteroidales bacterium]